MRLRYDDFTLKKIEELVKMGASNDDICDSFGVEKGYSSLITRVNKVRRELSEQDKINNLDSVDRGKYSTVAENCNSDVYISKVLKECTNSADWLNSVVVSKLSEGFKNIELEMVTGYSKQIGEIICKLENIQFLFDNISSIRKEK